MGLWLDGYDLGTQAEQDLRARTPVGAYVEAQIPRANKAPKEPTVALQLGPGLSIERFAHSAGQPITQRPAASGG